jgi:hypothetical protein
MCGSIWIYRVETCLSNQRFDATALQHFVGRHGNTVTPAANLLHVRVCRVSGFFTITVSSVFGPITSAHSDCLKIANAAAAGS